MALVKAEAVQGFVRLPAVRQLGLMVGLAASVALGVAVVLWSQEPNYSLLYGNLTDKDAGNVLEALQKAQIPYQVEQATGAVLVPSSKVHDARLKLAELGLPKGGGVGFELLEKDQGFGTSQFLEAARYQHALEGELARTIGALGGVQDARVHLAIPKESVFVRDREHPTASVLINLYPGRALENESVAAIVHLVASSVPHLSPNDVTVVDQQGRLLTSRRSTREMALTDDQFDYTRRIEADYTKRIEDILTPLVGLGGVRAQVTADLDFTMSEQTQERFNPDLPALRSEQTSEEHSTGGSTPAGVPGALTNQPPGAGTTAVPVTPIAGSAPGTSESAQNTSRQATRNYELDKTINHTQLPTGTIRHLSIAVVIDDRQTEGEDGAVQRKPLTPEELTRITALVKEAVGFDARRGDSVNVINASFQVPPEPEPLPNPPLWERPWVWDLLKQLMGAMGVVLLVFGVLRPVLRSLAEKGSAPALAAEGPSAARPGVARGVAEDRLSLSGAQPAQLAGPSGYEQGIQLAKTMVAQDPKRVAQVVKNWVGKDG